MNQNNHNFYCLFSFIFDSVFTHIKCKKEQPVDFTDVGDGDLYSSSSDLLWDSNDHSFGLPRLDSGLGDSVWNLASSAATGRCGEIESEEDILADSLLHSHDPLLTSTVLTAGDEAEEVNDLLFDELERITIISNPSRPSSPSTQLDLDVGMVSPDLFFIIISHYYSTTFPAKNIYTYTFI